ncbi:hypothetical protein AVEN_139013-1 [Araneus ventricosus]|uniref:Uncharacterized protein n=1 Tax=Araneus ventricosus TaxID=182803 RepID=A0A4Y2EZ00_ARAVE|nr:hypothetical protein AVEN_196292-1 [Araneus ventricosus]GBM33722.1 hypothetical protein AVEN_24717-1 [Araneus ventricosus]GBM33728.1 hypothetical protein AVEN_33596-1 [Araneus ventricosus]GBM33777.1 hypothetical protein AVEN_139013-1 [Araneus ventricosus]
MMRYSRLENMKAEESVREETPGRLIGADEDEPIIEEPPKVEYLDTIQPRQLRLVYSKFFNPNSIADMKIGSE